MKKITKRFLAVLLVFAMAMSTAVLTPTSASAATAKTKSTTLKVTDTKISGFKSIDGMLSLNSKYVIAYGKNSKGKNVYSYSTDGKTFRKAISLGLDGYVHYHSVGKNLYVFSSDESGNVSKYKYVSSPKNLKSAKTIDLKSKIKLPANANVSGFYFSGYGFEEAKTGKMYLSATYYIMEGNNSNTLTYSVVLNKGSVSVTNLTTKLKSILKTDRFYLNNYMNYAASANSFRAIVTGSAYDKNQNPTEFVFYTTDGKNYKKCPNLPKKDQDIYYTYQWVGSTLMAYQCSVASENSSTYLIQSDSKNRGIYYVYNASKNKWSKKTTGKSNKSGFSWGYGANVYVTYRNSSSTKNYATFFYNLKNSTKILYSSNALTWNSLPGLKRNSTAVPREYSLGQVSFEKTPSGTYATEYYYSSKNTEKQYLVISKLDKNKWKKVKAVPVKCVNHAYLYNIGLSNKIPSMIYNSGKTTAGYNLKTGKSYKLPFKFDYNMVMGGDTLVYSYGSKLYATKNTYKNMTRITLKSGKKKVSKEITRTGIQTVSKNTYVYFICGTKMYCTTINKLLSVK